MGANLAHALLLLLAAAAPAAVERVGGGPLLPCGTTDASSFNELQQAFVFAHGVCCTQLGETCAASAMGLPTTCASAICARAVALVNASCAALLVSPAFPVGIGFQPLLDAANDACAHAAAAGIADEGTNGGLLTDGMGSGGHNPSGSGQDFATVQASAGQVAQLDLHAFWVDQNNNLRVTVDDGEEVLLRGTVLPRGGRRFRSKPGGKIELLLVTDVLTSLSFVSLGISATCGDSSGCGGHGSCSGGNCTCSGWYSGMGCQCVAGYKPGGAGCVVDKCFDWPNQRPKTCSGHGSCDANSGECRCALGYKGVDCAEDDRSPYFPGSHLITKAGGDNLNGWMKAKAKGKQWSLCFSSFTDDATTPSTFHKQCDQYDTTLAVARNSLNYTFGGYAEGSWSKERCCAVQGNDCYSSFCYDYTSSSDYLYRLSPGEPERYETIPHGGHAGYQLVYPTSWPIFGAGDDLMIGGNGPPGVYLPGVTNGFCDQGVTYRGSPNAACGGNSNWGHTDLEVWFI